MCRFLAYLGPPATLESLVMEPPHSLLRQSWAPRRQRRGTVNADGFGVGWYAPERRPEPARYRTARPMWSDRSFASLAGVVVSPAILAAVRSATPPLPIEETGSPPFTAGPWLFAHNGAVDGFAGTVGPRLRRLVSDRRAAGIEGGSDAEVLFALALDRLDEGADAAGALSAVITTVTELTTARLNLVLTDGQRVVATAFGDSLFVHQGDGAVVVASEPYDDDASWSPVPDASVVEATAASVSVRPLALNGTPAAGTGTGAGHATASPTPPRRRVDVHLGPGDMEDALSRDVAAGLLATPKTLPPKWFYDERGSALFERITALPEYYPTRCERWILRAEAGVIAELTGADTLVELGSGTSEKTRLLLDALATAGRLRRFVPFDVCEAPLTQAAAAVAREYGVEVHAVVGDFERHLSTIPTGGRRLVAFLGGTLGNLAPPERGRFLSEVAAGLVSGDAFLVGVDLVKDVDRLVAAYDDAAGVTAEFNRNVLHVVNAALGADFVPERFDHVARWDPDQEWMEMWLRSSEDQKVTVSELGLVVEFAAGEAMRTEISAKFRRDTVEAELAAVGLSPRRWWTDPDGDFALSLSFKD